MARTQVALNRKDSVPVSMIGEHLKEEEKKSDLDKILSPEIRARAVRVGNEWLIPHPEVLQAIAVATDHLIAVLGVECFEILADGVKVENYSGYRFSAAQGDWACFVQQNNYAAVTFVKDNLRGDGHGYILTATSKVEYTNLSV